MDSSSVLNPSLTGIKLSSKFFILFSPSPNFKKETLPDYSVFAEPFRKAPSSYSPSFWPFQALVRLSDTPLSLNRSHAFSCSGWSSEKTIVSFHFRNRLGPIRLIRTKSESFQVRTKKISSIILNPLVGSEEYPRIVILENRRKEYIFLDSSIVFPLVTFKSSSKVNVRVLMLRQDNASSTVR